MTRRRRALSILGAVAAVLVLLALLMNPARFVTQAAHSEARRVCDSLEDVPDGDGRPIFEFRLFTREPEIVVSIGNHTETLADRYGFLFRAGYLDRDWIIRSLPRDGFTPEALPYGMVIMAFLKANRGKFDSGDHFDSEDIDNLIEEGLGWIRAVMASARAKEALVSLLIRDYEPISGRYEPAGLLKMGLASTLLLNDFDDYGPIDPKDWEFRPLADRFLAGLGERDWNAVLRDSRHPAEKVRAGAYLLLLHHPRKDLILERAREGLADPSPLVRLAAASVLAYRGSPDGRQALIDGLAHERREIRWWCGKLLARIGGSGSRAAIARQLPLEPDPWIRDEMEKMLRSFD